MDGAVVWVERRRLAYRMRRRGRWINATGSVALPACIATSPREVAAIYAWTRLLQGVINSHGKKLPLRVYDKRNPLVGGVVRRAKHETPTLLTLASASVKHTHNRFVHLSTSGC